MANIQHEDATPLYERDWVPSYEYMAEYLNRNTEDAPKDPALQSYRVAVTYWNEPAEVSEIGRDAVEDSISNLLDEIHSGRIMAFTIEGI